jgi:exodeoxyribonuclease VII small subunit
LADHHIKDLIVTQAMCHDPRNHLVQLPIICRVPVCLIVRQDPTECHLVKPIKGGQSPAESSSAAADAQADLPQDFETALAQLEQLVSKMESGALPLEESLAAYRRGVSLTRVCQERLAQAQQQVSVLEADLLRPFEAADRQSE